MNNNCIILLEVVHFCDRLKCQFFFLDLFFFFLVFIHNIKYIYLYVFYTFIVLYIYLYICICLFYSIFIIFSFLRFSLHSNQCCHVSLVPLSSSVQFIILSFGKIRKKFRFQKGKIYDFL